MPFFWSLTTMSPGARTLTHSLTHAHPPPTLRPDACRFGKFIELRFEKDGQLVGGFVHTYLLEKVRAAGNTVL